MPVPLLSVQGLKTQFNQPSETIKAVDGISFDIAEGEAFALVGESGCGKSISALSVLRLLPNNAQITAGKVIYRGSDLLRMPEKNMREIRGVRISMIFQDPMTSLNPVMTIGEQIAEAVLTHKKSSASEIRKRVISLIQQVGISDPEERYSTFPHQLSGGMRQRVMIAIALANEPDLLIADEPTTALDVTIQSQILQLLKDLQRQMGMSLWIITHDLGIVADIADKVAVMYAGQLVEVASRDDFFKKPLHPYSRRLFDALPDLHKRKELLVTLTGAVPKLSGSFVGCRFAERCDYKEHSCTELPELGWAIFSNDHHVRCVRVDNLELIEKSGNILVEGTSELDDDSPLIVKGLKVYFPIKKGLLKRTVGQVKAVDDVSFELPAGTTTALVGESGCGKTTLGKALLQLLPITEGDVEYKGQNLATLSEQAFKQYREQLQIIFQDPFSSMNPRMLVGDILEEGIRALRSDLTDADIEHQCDTLLEKVGLNSDVRLRYPHEFSGGQRQRLCIARALAVNPSIIVCDEPTSALDVSVQAQVLNLLKKLQNEQGLSYLFITHDLSVVAYLADTVAVMYLGRIVEYGTVDDVLNNPAHPYTKALIEAVPTWDASLEKTVVKLPDNMPSPSNPPDGCHFHTRCEHVMPDCRQIKPRDVNLSSSHKVACLLFTPNDD
ncbi:MAG: ABC transporter ATP-binding protein [Cycloclasticus sp.]|jgi:peptide/nickel transport system ATP-binding protein|nr:ABC transporter ATP-binding protein [Cycloclasticus sp.]